jgi:hypothetical protein
LSVVEICHVSESLGLTFDQYFLRTTQPPAWNVQKGLESDPFTEPRQKSGGDSSLLLDNGYPSQPKYVDPEWQIED